MKSTIIDHLIEPFVIAKHPINTNNKTILYVYSDAFTTCDCGKDLMLTQKIYANATYTGICSCGKYWKLLNGMIGN